MLVDTSQQSFIAPNIHSDELFSAIDLPNIAETGVGATCRNPRQTNMLDFIVMRMSEVNREKG